MSFIDHAKKVAKTASVAQPALQGVFHAKDGKAIVTDGHRMYRKENAHTFGKDVLLNPNDLSAMDENYPETDRLIPDTKPKTTMAMNINKKIVASLKGSLKAAKTDRVGGNLKNPLVKLLVKGGSARIDVLDGYIHQSIHVRGDGEEITSYLRYQYLVESLDMLLDDTYAKEAEVMINLFSSMRPVTIHRIDDLSTLALIMPVRNGR